MNVDIREIYVVGHNYSVIKIPSGFNASCFICNHPFTTIRNGGYLFLDQVEGKYLLLSQCMKCSRVHHVFNFSYHGELKAGEEFEIDLNQIENLDHRAEIYIALLLRIQETGFQTQTILDGMLEMRRTKQT